MPRRKSKKIPANTRVAKQADWSLVRHNNRAGVSAFKKRLRAQFGRREGTRELKALAEHWHGGTPVPPRYLLPRDSVSQRGRVAWVLDDTMRIAFQEAGL